jgi:glucose 1-dehydrogenase
MNMTVTYDLAGKVAIVTGATGGMGRAITRALAASGANVMAADRSVVDGFVDEHSGLAGEVALRAVDVSVEREVASLVDATVDRFGRLDVAINAAAIEFETVPLADSTAEDFDRMIAVNSRGVFLCMKHELRVLVDQGDGGSIVNIASTSSHRPQHEQSAYTASKFAVLGLTMSAAIDYAKFGIRVNAISPGAIDTPMLRSAMERRGRNAEDVARRLSRFGRFGRPEEIAQAALWLCSEGSSFTTGHALAVDGGMLAG